MRIEYEKEKIVDFSYLEPGDAFVFNHYGSAGYYSVYIKCQETKAQMAIDLRTGKIYKDCCGKLVTPVAAVVK